MNSNQISSNVAVALVDNDWRIAGIGDFNGDGKSDILCRHDSGYVLEWLMNGDQIASNLGVTAVSTDWHVVGTGDFNGDGKCDIMWRHDSGYVVEWLMNSNQIAGNLGVAGVQLTGISSIRQRHRSGAIIRCRIDDGMAWTLPGTRARAKRPSSA